MPPLERLQTARDTFARNTRQSVKNAGDFFCQPLFDHQAVKSIVDRVIPGIEIEIPDYIQDFLKDKSARAILAGNYPPNRHDVVTKTFKMASHLMGHKTFRAIAGEDILVHAPLPLRVLGINKIVYPAKKNDKERHTLVQKVKDQINAQLKKPGTVLWQSITGKTEGNGLLIKDGQLGAATWSATHQIPIIPMAYITEMRHGKEEIVKIRFGRPIAPPNIEGITSVTTLYDVYSGHTELVMFRIAELLPDGKRGDFEDLAGWREKLNIT